MATIVSCQRVGPGIVANIAEIPDIDVSDIAQRPRGLPHELELELLLMIQSGTGLRERRSSLQELVGEYFHVMIAVAQRYESCGLSLRERVAAARIGFLRAVEDYAIGECVEFSLCAVQTMKEHVRYALAGR